MNKSNTLPEEQEEKDLPYGYVRHPKTGEVIFLPRKERRRLERKYKNKL